MAAKYADRITFFSVDTDSCPALAVQYQAQSIPQITAISADSVVANQIGSMSEADFTAYIESRCFSKPTIHDNTKNASCTELCTGSVFHDVSGLL